MKHFIASPEDSRYIPFTQQRLCCVPTVISMIMYRNHIPLLPIEELGYHLGLVVSPEDAHLFYNARISGQAPPYGYGTQIQEPEYNPNVVFQKLNIPLEFRIVPPQELKDANGLLMQLRYIIGNDGDVGLCFDWNTLHKKKSSRNCGHIVLVDRIVNNQIRIIDPERNQPKYQLFNAEIMFKALQHHARFSGGIWLFRRTGSNLSSKTSQ